MTYLNDLQCILLSGAARRDDGCLWPLPDSASDPAALKKAVSALLRKGLIGECEAESADISYRSADGRHHSVHITEAGMQAISVVPNATSAPLPSVPVPERLTKATLLKTLLEREQGAIMSELTEATGWLPHTVRASLTGLRKKGAPIERSSRDGRGCWHIRVPA